MNKVPPSAVHEEIERHAADLAALLRASPELTRKDFLRLLITALHKHATDIEEAGRELREQTAMNEHIGSAVAQVPSVAPAAPATPAAPLPREPLSVMASTPEHANENREQEVLEHIRSGPPSQWRQEYEALVERRRFASLSPAEERRLVSLADRMEEFNAQWLEWLMELADLRKAPLDDVMESLRLPTHRYA
ncbi:MAG: hypothetical protein HYY24_21625 [Verrucomicrobia bacterium]|nr:hypothetical protein [Verrucomicrobiota bacterium]